MKRLILSVLLVVFAAVVGVAIAPATSDADEPADNTADVVFLGDLDLAERLEIWRNQYRRMMPGDAPLIQDVGTWPAAWEEFSSVWDTAPAERDLATWLVPFYADRMCTATVLRDANGTALWSGATDFAKDGSANVTLTGALVDEQDWPLYTAAQNEISRRFEAMASQGNRGGPYTNGLRFTNVWVATNGDYHFGFGWESNGEVQVFCRAMHTTSWVETVVYTNDENQVVTNDFSHWRELDKFKGRPDSWEVLGVLTVTNGGGSFTDTNLMPDYDKVRFYTAAKYADSDGNGITDGEEWAWGITSTTTDSDNDGLTDYQERKDYRTDPDNPDTDGDGLTDGAEVSLGTDPKKTDTDCDGLPDGWEVHNELNPLVATGADGPDGDPDEDGFLNLFEYELDAPANNNAWNGNELAWKLMHVTPVVTTNGNSVTTNLTGLLVEVEDSWDCVTGGNTNHQDVTTSFVVPDLLDCGYYVEVGIAGSVEDVDDNYDKVYFNAYSNNFYFSSHDGIPDSLGPEAEECRMVSEYAVKENLVLSGSTIGLRYDTVGYKWHSGGYAQVVSAVCVAALPVEIVGPTCLIVGDTAQLSVASDVGGTYSWSVSGAAATITQAGMLTAVTSGVCVVTAANTTGCAVSKEIVVLSIDAIQIRELDAICNRAPNPKQTSTNRLFVAEEETGDVEIEIVADVQPADCSEQVMCSIFGVNDCESAHLGPDGTAVLVFTQYENVENGMFGIGLDDNGNGMLDYAELRMISTNMLVTSFSDAHYRGKRGELSFGAHNALTGYELSSSLLIRFLNEGAPPLSFDSSSNAVINCFSQSNLTHNTGARFDTNGNAVVEVNTWDTTGLANTRIAESIELEHLVNTILTNNIAEATNYLASHPNDNTYAAMWTTNNAHVNFDKGVSEGLHEHDLHLAFGNAVISELTVWVAVKRGFLGGYSIGQLSIEGVLEDLYDFDYERTELNSDAAVLQIGWDDTTEGRDAGVVFFDKTFFRRTFDSWSSFDF